MMASASPATMWFVTCKNEVKPRPCSDLRNVRNNRENPLRDMILQFHDLSQKIVLLMPWLSNHLDSCRPIERYSHKTVGFSEQNSCVGKRVRISDEPDAFVSMLDTKQGIRSSFPFTSTGDFLCVARPSRSFCSPHLSLFRASVK